MVAGVRLTNPDRVLWPETGITKLELVRYYQTVAERMLPHTANRPLSLVRCPAGSTAECFYQKHIENFPETVGTVGIFEPAEDRSVPYAKVTSLSSLIGLAQMGVLEIHTWGSRADNPDRPDRLVFDLDPDPVLPWTTLVATALLMRSELDRLGLKSWVKTTGGKGLHLVVPLTRRQSWTGLRDFAKAFADRIVALEPRQFTTNIRKTQRDGRIFIDYFRNMRGSTAIAPYSTRARPGAPVSVPLAWDDLASQTTKPDFTLRNVSTWLADDAQDPWHGLVTARQSLTHHVLGKLGMPIPTGV